MRKYNYNFPISLKSKKISFGKRILKFNRSWVTLWWYGNNYDRILTFKHQLDDFISHWSGMLHVHTNTNAAVVYFVTPSHSECTIGSLRSIILPIMLNKVDSPWSLSSFVVERIYVLVSFSLKKLPSRMETETGKFRVIYKAGNKSANHKLGCYCRCNLAHL